MLSGYAAGLPQLPQNFALGASSVPHSAQWRTAGASGLPQLPQNFPLPTLPHLAQVTWPAAGAAAAGGGCGGWP